MTPFKVPAGESEIELIEKKSRFISRIFQIETAEQAQEILQKIRKQHWDASHNVHAYILENGVMRIRQKDEKWGSLFMTALFLGMISAFLGMIFATVSEGLRGWIPCFVMIASALIMCVCAVFVKLLHWKWMEDYALPLSMLGGMALSIPITNLVNMIAG